MKKKKFSVAEKLELYVVNTLPIFRFESAFLAENLRKVGNEFYKNELFHRAIQQYNKLLCFSKSLEIRGIAYSNLSAAYLALRSYQDCLESVRLAKDFPLPANIMLKVLEREKIALEGLKSKEYVPKTNIPIELSYPRHEIVPSFVFFLELKDARNAYGGIITTKKLLPGDVVVVEPLLASYIKSFDMCTHCLRRCGSLQPCKCKFVLFCSQECKEEAFETYHNIECPLMEHLYVYPEEECVVLRAFFNLIQRFKDFKSLREYFENIKTPNPFDDNNEYDAGSFESKFRIFYGTEQPPVVKCKVLDPDLLRKNENNENMYVAKTAIIIELLKTSKEIPRFAETTDQWLFLSKQLYRIFIYKLYTIREFASQKDAVALYGTASLFKTSCQQNLQFNYEKNILVVRATKCIEPGTELLAPSQ